MSEHSHTNSSLRIAVPIKPSSLFMYSFLLATTTFVASILSKIFISVLRSLLLPYFFFKALK